MRKARVRLGAHRANAIVIGVALTVLMVAGCSDMDAAKPVMIVNLTSGPVDVTLHHPAGDADLPTAKTIPAGETQAFYGPLLDSCMTGSLVAVRDGRTIAIVDKPCQGSRWEITDTGASQSS